MYGLAFFYAAVHPCKADYPERDILIDLVRISWVVPESECASLAYKGEAMLDWCCYFEKAIKLYDFQSFHNGPCRVEARTSGKHGFGLPKHFEFTSRDGGFSTVHILWYRDNGVDEMSSTEHKRNVDLVRIAIGQFCEMCVLAHDTKDELRLQSPIFCGEITNRHGRVISETSVLPKARVLANNTQLATYERTFQREVAAQPPAAEPNRG